MESTKSRPFFQRLKHQLKNSGIKDNKVYIIPSRFGLLYLAVLFFSIILAVSFGHSFSYFLSALMFVFFVLASFISNSYVKDIKLSHIPGSTMCEESSLMPIKFSVESLGDEVINCSVEFEKTSKDIIVHEKSSIFTYYLNFKKWGCHSKVRMKLFSSYPFFLFYTWKYIDIKDDFIIYPKVPKRELNRLKDNSLHEFSDIEQNKYKEGE